MSVDNGVPQDVALTDESDAPQAARRPWQGKLAGLVVVGLLAAVVWHVDTRIDPSLIYYGDLVELPSQQAFLVNPIFATGSDFLAPFLTRPGGLAEWAGAYLGQHFHTTFGGTLILGLLAVVVFLSTNAIVAAMSGRPARYMGAWPVLLLVGIWGRYVFHVGDCLALCVALLACAGYLRLHRPVTRVVAVLVGTCVLYYALGAPALLFAGMCGLAELIRWRLWWLGVVALVVGAAVPIVVGVWMLGSTMPDAYLRMSGAYSHGSRQGDASQAARVLVWRGIYGVGVLAVLVGGLKGWWGRRQELKSDAPNGRLASLTGVVFAGVVVVAAVVAFLGVDTDARSLLRIHRHALNNQWQAVLKVTRDQPPAQYSRQSLREINRALAETGQLGARMFTYPQNEWGLLAPMTTTYQSVVEVRTFMQLGMLSQGENLAAELLTQWGPRPSVLRVQAEIFIIKGEPKAAAVFLNRLSKDVIQGPWARQTLAALQADPLMEDDAEISHYRSMIQSREVFDLTYSGILYGLVREDAKKYHLAFEYLMGQCLLDRPTGEGDQVGHMRRMGVLLTEYAPMMGYNTLPRHYTEVRVLHLAVTGEPVMLDGHPVPPITLTRFERCYEVLKEYWPDLAKADAILAKEMPNSYFRYYYTGRSGPTPAP
mgnify:CR=1 FL=1